MNVLIVDNGTEHLPALKRLFKNDFVKVVSPKEVSLKDANEADFIVLSGGSEHPAIDGRYFQRELKIIKKSKKPTLGICLGFELIAKAFGAKIVKMKRKIAGNRVVEWHTDNSKDPGRIVVREAHRWVVKEVKKPLIPFAWSPSGIEAVRHARRRLVGVQFHPELSYNQKLFLDLIENVIGSKQNARATRS